MVPDILAHPCRRGRCKCTHDRAAGQTIDELLDAQIARAEILSPLADAVRLVHRHHADGPLLREPLEPRHLESFGRDVDDLIPALARTAEHQDFLVVGQTVVQKCRRDTGLYQCADLIFHQAHQRRYHDGDTRQQQSRHLITDGFACTGRHHRQNIPSG